MSKLIPAARYVLGVMCCVTGLAACSRAVEESQSRPAKPFPQHSKYVSGTILPSHVSQAQLDAVAKRCYDEWKNCYVAELQDTRELYVRSLGPGASAKKKAICVSEGQGYGLIITAFMAGHDPDAREMFDALFRFCRSHPSRINSSLMAWRQEKGGQSSKDNDSASDGDLDIAFALLLADAQWGSRGETNYRKEALANIAAIKKDEINREAWTVKLGDWVSPKNKYYFATRPSDFMTDHFKTFRAVTGDDDWARVIDRCYSVIEDMQKEYSPHTGLIPDFVTISGSICSPAEPGFLEGDNDGAYYYNSCRVPFRLGIDRLTTGDERAGNALKKINKWIVAETGGEPSKIRAGYNLQGSIIDEGDSSQAFTACFAVGAMGDGSNEKWLNALWDSVEKADTEREGYYASTLRMLCVIALSGNWWQPVTPGAE